MLLGRLVSYCLNPYSNGMKIEPMVNGNKAPAIAVLILILME